MSRAMPRRRAAGRAGLMVTVTAPDGGASSIRGLGTWLTRAAPARACGEVTVALVSDARMRSLNRAFRGRDHATDVLSFPVNGVAPPGGSAARGSLGKLGPYLGDIAIATGVARRQADDAGHSLTTELRVLALHGLLHLLGYDHETDTGQMARLEAKLRRRSGLKA